MMMRNLIGIAALAFMLPLGNMPAYASSTVPFYTGSATGTYHSIGEDVQALLAKSSQQHAPKLEPMHSDGSIENIRNIAKHDGVALGLVQADVLHFMRRSNNPDTKQLATQIRMMMPLYQEEVHVLAKRNIETLEDLRGKRVVVGEEGSGNMLTAVNLLAINDIRVGETLRLTPERGVMAVLEGTADAVIYVSGKPVKLFKNLENLHDMQGQRLASLLDHVHFVAVATPQALAEYTRAEITQDDYRFVTQPVPTVAVQAILVAGNYASKSRQAECSVLQQLAQEIRRGIRTLKQEGHPKWRDTNISKPVALWQKDRCSWPDKKTRINLKQGGR